MRAFAILCFIGAAAAQYEYTANGQQTVFAGTNGATSTLAEPEVTVNEYNKEYYTYAAPEQDFDDAQAQQKIADAVKKNLRVVFIKGPENQGLENAVLQLAQTTADQRTAIYVLNKQTDIADFADKFSALNQQSNRKPDVHFVKYRTQAEAEYAQKAIQKQYDSLPGASTNTNGGIAPVLDFASRSAARADGGLGGLSSSAAVPTKNIQNLQQQAGYLPPDRRF